LNITTRTFSDRIQDIQQKERSLEDHIFDKALANSNALSLLDIVAIEMITALLQSPIL
jgi:hypothetical protein